MRTPDAAASEKVLNPSRDPVVLNGTLLDCYAAGPVDGAALREAGVGQANPISKRSGVLNSPAQGQLAYYSHAPRQLDHLV